MTSAVRPAATVVLVRRRSDGSSGWETYLLRRSAQSPVLADLWVFPGGTLRPDDRVSSVANLSPDFGSERAHADLARASSGPAGTPQESLAYFIAAARELFEEAGVLLGMESSADPVLSSAPADERLNVLRQRRLDVEQGRGFAELVAEMRMTLALDRLVSYSHWITPEALPQRFDTRFFLAELPAGQEATPSPFEMAEGIWIDPAQALERSRDGSLPLHFATTNHLRLLVPYRNLEDLFAFARAKPIVTVMPETREVKGRVVPSLPNELEGVW